MASFRLHTQCTSAHQQTKVSGMIFSEFRSSKVTHHLKCDTCLIKKLPCDCCLVQGIIQNHSSVSSYFTFLYVSCSLLMQLAYPCFWFVLMLGPHVVNYILQPGFARPRTNPLNRWKRWGKEGRRNYVFRRCHLLWRILCLSWLLGDEKKAFFLVHLLYYSYVFFSEGHKDYTFHIHSLDHCSSQSRMTSEFIFKFAKFKRNYRNC